MDFWGQLAGDAIQKMQSGIVILDSDLRIVDVNQFAATSFGILPEEVKGSPFGDLCDGFDVSLFHHSIRDGLDVSIEEQEISIMNQKRIVTGTITPITVLGQICGLMFVFQDITMDRGIRKEIVRAEKMATIGQMAAGTVHEIRNPLTTIKGFLQIFDKEIAKLSSMGLVQKNFAEKCKHIFPVLFTEIHRMEKILHDFLVISQQQEVEFEVISLQDVLSETLPLLQQEAMQKGVGLIVQFPKRHFHFFGNKQEMKEILENVVRNAFEALSGHENAEIRISTRSDLDSFIIDVEDNGSGIPSEIIEEILEPFISTKDSTGLGLSICQHLLGKLGGSLAVRSKEGIGTCISIRVPINNDLFLHPPIKLHS